MHSSPAQAVDPMPEALLAAADGALYKAKHGGRNRVSMALLIVPDAGGARERE